MERRFPTFSTALLSPEARSFDINIESTRRGPPPAPPELCRSPSFFPSSSHAGLRQQRDLMKTFDERVISDATSLPLPSEFASGSSAAYHQAAEQYEHKPREDHVVVIEMESPSDEWDDSLPISNVEGDIRDFEEDSDWVHEEREYLASIYPRILISDAIVINEDYTPDDDDEEVGDASSSESVGCYTSCPCSPVSSRGSSEYEGRRMKNLRVKLNFLNGVGGKSVDLVKGFTRKLVITSLPRSLRTPQIQRRRHSVV